MVARFAAVGSIVLAVIVLASSVAGDQGRHRYFMVFQTAGQLVPDDDVQVGGRRVGSIKEIRLTEDNLARIEIEVGEPFAPLREGTRGVIRATSLSGVANRYIALHLAPQSAPRLPDDAVLPPESTTSIVDLDQLFNTLDDRTRRDLQKLVQGFAVATEGRGDEAAEAAEYFNPALSASRRLVQQVTADEGALTEFLVSSSRAVTALAERRDQLAGAVAGAERTAGAIAAENRALSESLVLLPGTLRRANTTWVNLRATLGDLDELVEASDPASRRLAPFLRELRPLVAAARPTIADLRRLVARRGAGNDLTDATRRLPALQRAGSPALRHATAALVKAQPVLEFVRPYAPEVVGWLRDFSQGAANYDANGHFARIQPIINAFSLTDNPAGGVLSPIPPEQRLDNLETRMMRRCPGGATQSAADASSPFTDDGALGADDCDPTQDPPGP